MLTLTLTLALTLTLTLTLTRLWRLGPPRRGTRGTWREAVGCSCLGSLQGFDAVGAVGERGADVAQAGGAVGGVQVDAARAAGVEAY